MTTALKPEAESLVKDAMAMAEIADLAKQRRRCVTIHTMVTGGTVMVTNYDNGAWRYGWSPDAGGAIICIHDTLHEAWDAFKQTCAARGLDI